MLICNIKITTVKISKQKQRITISDGHKVQQTRDFKFMKARNDE